MKGKIVVTRKPHKCDFCDIEIPKGSQTLFEEFKSPRYDDKDNQIGIVFNRFYMCNGCKNELIVEQTL